MSFVWLTEHTCVYLRLCFTITEGNYYKLTLRRGMLLIPSCSASCTVLTVTYCCSECCVPSGLDFEGLQLCWHCTLLSNYCFKSIKLRTLGALSWLSAEILERLPTRLFGRLVGWSALLWDYGTLYLLDIGIQLVPTSLRLTLRSYYLELYISRTKKCKCKC